MSQPGGLHDDLVAAVRSGKALLAIGAGVSYAVTGQEVARWSGLLANGLDRCAQLDPRLGSGWCEAQKALLRSAFDTGDQIGIIGAASQIESRLGYPGQGEWERWLNETVGRLAATDTSLLQALRAVAVMCRPFPVICTTNYDTLLADALELEPVAWTEKSKVDALVRGERAGVLHLHGHWRDPRTVVLGQRGYDDVGRDEHAQVIEKLLLIMKTIVFIGFGAGLRDANLGSLLWWRGRNFAHDPARSYRLALRSELIQVQAEHQGDRVLAVPYGDTYGELAHYLARLPGDAERPEGQPGTPAEAGATEEAVDATLTGYLRALVKNSEWMSTSDARGPVQQSVLLEDAYVSLDVAPDKPDVDRRNVEAEIEKAKREIANLDDPQQREHLANIWTEHYDRIREVRDRSYAERTPVDELLERERFLVILGHPGSGKSTLVRYWTLKLARRLLADPSALFADPPRAGSTPGDFLGSGPLLPIPVRVSNYAEARRREPDLALHDYLPRYLRGELQLDIEEPVLKALLTRALRSGRCTLLLDGVDEIPSLSERVEIVGVIERFVASVEDYGRSLARARESPHASPILSRSSEGKGLEFLAPQQRMLQTDDLGGNRFLVTSRIAGYRNAGLGGKFRHFTILELSPETRRVFLRNWCKVLVHRTADAELNRTAASQAERMSEEILEALENVRGLSLMSSTPLLLRIVAEVYQRHRDLPQRRAELYERAVRTLLHDWNERKGADTIELHDAIAWLGPVAHWLLEHMPSGTVSEQQAELLLAKAIADEGLGPAMEEPSTAAHNKARAFLRLVRESSGIFIEVGEGIYGFAHRTFLEYFVARELMRRSSAFVENLLNRLHQPRWREPILLGIGLTSQYAPDDIPQILEAILKHPGRYEDVLCRNVLFAADCLMECAGHYHQVGHLIAQRLLNIAIDRWGRGRFTRLRARAATALRALCEAGYAGEVAAVARESLQRHTDRKVRVALLKSLAELPIRTGNLLLAPSDLFDPLTGSSSRILEHRERVARAGTVPRITDQAVARMIALHWHFEPEPLGTMLGLGGDAAALRSRLTAILETGREARDLLARLEAVLGEVPEPTVTTLMSLRMSAQNTFLRAPAGSRIEAITASVGRLLASPSDFHQAHAALSAERDALKAEIEAGDERDLWRSLAEIGSVMTGGTLVGLFATSIARETAARIDESVVDDDKLASAPDRIRSALLEICRHNLHHPENTRAYGEALWLIASLDMSQTVELLRTELAGRGRCQPADALRLFAMIGEAADELAPMANAMARQMLERSDEDHADLALEVLRRSPIDSETLRWLLARAEHEESWATRARKMLQQGGIAGTPETFQLLDEAIRNPALRPLLPDLLEHVDQHVPILPTAYGIAWLLDEEPDVRQYAATYFLRWGRTGSTTESSALVEPEWLSGLRSAVWADGTPWSQEGKDGGLPLTPEERSRLRELWTRGWGDAISLAFTGKASRQPGRTPRNSGWSIGSGTQDRDCRVRTLESRIDELLQEACWPTPDSPLRAAVQDAPLAAREEACALGMQDDPAYAVLLPRHWVARALDSNNELAGSVRAQIGCKTVSEPVAPAQVRSLLSSPIRRDRAVAAIALVPRELGALRMLTLFDALHSRDDRLRFDAVIRIYETAISLRPAIDAADIEAHVACILAVNAPDQRDIAEPLRATLRSTYCCGVYFDDSALLEKWLTTLEKDAEGDRAVAKRGLESLGGASVEVSNRLIELCRSLSPNDPRYDAIVKGLFQLLHHFQLREDAQLAAFLGGVAKQGCGTSGETAISALRMMEGGAAELAEAQLCELILESQEPTRRSSTLVALGQVLLGQCLNTDHPTVGGRLPHEGQGLELLKLQAADRNPSLARAAACGLALAYRFADARTEILTDLLHEPQRVLNAMLDAEARGGWRERQRTEDTVLSDACDWFATLSAAQRQGLLAELLSEIETLATTEPGVDANEFADRQRKVAILEFLAELSEHVGIQELLQATGTTSREELTTWIGRLPGNDTHALTAAVVLFGNCQYFTRVVGETMFSLVDEPRSTSTVRRAARKMRNFASESLTVLTDGLYADQVVHAYCAALLLGELGGSQEIDPVAREEAGRRLYEFLHCPLANRAVYLPSEINPLAAVEYQGQLYDFVFDALAKIVGGSEEEQILSEGQLAGSTSATPLPTYLGRKIPWRSRSGRRSPT